MHIPVQKVRMQRSDRARVRTKGLCVHVILSSGLESGSPQQAAQISTMNVDFDAVFGSQGANNDVKPAAGKIPAKAAYLSI